MDDVTEGIGEYARALWARFPEWAALLSVKDGMPRVEIPSAHPTIRTPFVLELGGTQQVFWHGGYFYDFHLGSDAGVDEAERWLRRFFGEEILRGLMWSNGHIFAGGPLEIEDWEVWAGGSYGDRKEAWSWRGNEDRAVGPPVPPEAYLPGIPGGPFEEGSLADFHLQERARDPFGDGTYFEVATAAAFYQCAVGDRVVPYDSLTWPAEAYAAGWEGEFEEEDRNSVRMLHEGRVRVTTVREAEGRLFSELGEDEPLLRAVTRFEGREYEILLGREGRIIGELPRA